MDWYIGGLSKGSAGRGDLVWVGKMWNRAWAGTRVGERRVGRTTVRRRSGVRLERIWIKDRGENSD